MEIDYADNAVDFLLVSCYCAWKLFVVEALEPCALSVVWAYVSVFSKVQDACHATVDGRETNLVRKPGRIATGSAGGMLESWPGMRWSVSCHMSIPSIALWHSTPRE